MKTDLYTKVILTVIAIALILHLVKDINLVEKANAAPLPTPFAAQTDGVIDVNIVQVDGKNVWNTDIPVRVKNSSSEKIPVEIKNSSYDKIPVEVKNQSSIDVSCR